MGTINSSMQAVQQAQADLGHVDNLPPLGHDLVRPSVDFMPSNIVTMSTCFLIIQLLVLLGREDLRTSDLIRI